MLIRDLAIRVLIERSLVVVVAIVVPVVVAVAVPRVVVRHLAAIAIPVAVIVAFSIMTRFHPSCAVVRWTSPVSVVPPVVVAHGVPIAAYPSIAGARTSWLNSDHTYGWRRADSHSDGKLSEDGSRCEQHQYHQKSSRFDFLSIDYMMHEHQMEHVVGPSIVALAACLRLLTFSSSIQAPRPKRLGLAFPMIDLAPRGEPRSVRPATPRAGTRTFGIRTSRASATLVGRASTCTRDSRFVP